MQYVKLAVYGHRHDRAQYATHLGSTG